ncbi:MAG: hypothetical protein AAGH70_05795 [Pseudomonadota bacterium]
MTYDAKPRRLEKILLEDREDKDLFCPEPAGDKAEDCAKRPAADGPANS